MSWTKVSTSHEAVIYLTANVSTTYQKDKCYRCQWPHTLCFTIRSLSSILGQLALVGSVWHGSERKQTFKAIIPATLFSLTYRYKMDYKKWHVLGLQTWTDLTHFTFGFDTFNLTWTEVKKFTQNWKFTLSWFLLVFYFLVSLSYFYCIWTLKAHL